MSRLKKKINLVSSFLESTFHPLPIWVHLWITNKCNLDCNYCYVVDNHSPNPATTTVKSWITHADNLGSAIVAFMGGEPTLRTDLSELISFANDRNLITYVTTNGKLLDYSRIEQLALAGLDVLELSLDGYGSIPDSHKTLHGDETIIDQLVQAREEYGMKFKIHQVLTSSTIEETPQLLELSRRKKVPISFGLVYHHSGETENHSGLKAVLQMILHKKEAGAQIINPASYFTDMITSFDHPVRINCDTGRYMIQVATDGCVYNCSKLASKKAINFLDLDSAYFKEDQHGSKLLLEQCADKCFSACAYSNAFFRRHPLRLILTYEGM